MDRSTNFGKAFVTSNLKTGLSWSFVGFLSFYFGFLSVLLDFLAKIKNDNFDQQEVQLT